MIPTKLLPKLDLEKCNFSVHVFLETIKTDTESSHIVGSNGIYIRGSYDPDTCDYGSYCLCAKA